MATDSRRSLAGVRFDFSGIGLREQVAWTAPDSDDAFLAIDENHNGVSEENELESLVHAGFTKIYLGYEDVSQLDTFGNMFHYEGTAALKTPNGVEVTRRATAVRLVRAAQR